MKKNSKTGPNTYEGGNFEKKQNVFGFVSLYLKEMKYELIKDYEISNDKLKNREGEVWNAVRNNKVELTFLRKTSLYRYLKRESVNWNDYISSKLLPDELIINNSTKKVIIIEKKFQETPGSVDEKLQTCDFKKQQYEKLLSFLNYEIIYIYILSDEWFNNPNNSKKYKDVYEYIIQKNCYYFMSNNVPSAKELINFGK